MRSFEERIAEIERRGEEGIKNRNKRRFHILAVCIPLLLCISLYTALVLPMVTPGKDSDSNNDSTGKPENTGTFSSYTEVVLRSADETSTYYRRVTDNVYYDKENRRVEVDFLTVKASESEEAPNMTCKPVIYLYPEVETRVAVKLTLTGNLTCTYPAYRNGWEITALPDGTLTDTNGQIYNYLYWEGVSYARYDHSKGFCVKGEDTAVFLEIALAQLGLTRREANEFIVYWLPLMQENPFNIISFQTDVYTDMAKLEVDPMTDTLIRVFMAWQAADEYVEIEGQTLSAPERIGFTVVEWGGTEMSADLLKHQEQ